MEKPGEVKVFGLSSNDLPPTIIPPWFVHKEEESQAIIANLVEHRRSSDRSVGNTLLFSPILKENPYNGRTTEKIQPREHCEFSTFFNIETIWYVFCLVPNGP